MHKKRGTGMVFAGLLILSAALFLILHNAALNAQARKSSAEAVAAMGKLSREQQPVFPPIPETVSRVIREMPEITVSGQSYIGTLEIPGLNLTLGVISQWSEERLRIAPCRYTGSLYSDDLVIAAHNYAAHFGNLIDLQIGDAVYFTDTEGVTTAYTVADLEILMPEDVEKMTCGEWDLSLFTCTVGGGSRITVRCSRGV